MVNSSKASTLQAAPVSPAVKKPVRKAPPPPMSATTPATSINGNHEDQTPPISPDNSSDQKALESPVFIEQSSTSTTVKPPITSPKPKLMKKSISVDKIPGPPVDEPSPHPSGVKVPPKPPVRGSSLISDMDESTRRHSSFEENDANKTAKPVPKKRTKSVHH